MELLEFLVLCYLGGLPLLDSISWFEYLFHHLILKSQDMFLKHISNRNGEQHYMLQVMKLFCNCGLLRYLHSNGSMKSARLQLGLGFTSLSPCCPKNKQRKRWERKGTKRMRKYFVFLKNREVINWSVWLDV